jgi:hypothetical protein
VPGIFPGGKGQLVRGADSLTTICELIVYKIWEPQRLTTRWAFMACYRDSFIFYFYNTQIKKLKGSFMLSAPHYFGVLNLI